ncbi:hypothetical protein LPJ70_002835 [Coemansia sp. RSA 2708]|nr:hypothetical protein LPJ70_002835 [Coemansia sp. RSA 2708]
MFAPPSAEHVQRTIRDVYRNFGADDGGEWMAASAGGQYFRIDREAVPGSQLTREEFARGPIRAPNPVSSSSSMAAYEPLPGVVPAAGSAPAADADARVEAALLRPARAAASQAQLNELTHDLFEHVLPRIRAIPGNGEFHFSTTEALRPTYLARTSADPVGAAGRTLTSLGDAFVELGRSLQALGTEWQMHYSDDAIQQQSRSTLLLLGELLAASPLAVPFLQARLPGNPAPPPPPRPADASLLEYQQRLHAANFHRQRRYRALEMLADPAPAHPAVGSATLELQIQPFAIPFGHHAHPPTPQGPPQGPPQGQSQGPPQGPVQGSAPPQALQQLIMQHLSQLRSPSAGTPGPAPPNSAPDATARANSAPGSESPANATRRPRVAWQLPGAHSLEIIFERVGSPSDAPPAERVSSAPEPPASRPEPQPRADADAGLTDFVDRLGALGSQSARSDRSNASTTTEYSTGTEPWLRVPRIFGVHMGSSGMQPPALHSMFGELMSRASNPFANASVFLGAETGSTTSTTRRASVSSSAGHTQDTASAPVATEPAAVSTGPPAVTTEPAAVDTEPASAAGSSSSAQPASPRTGETRARAASVASDTAAVDADECVQRAGSVANKRHRSDDNDDART